MIFCQEALQSFSEIFLTVTIEVSSALWTHDSDTDDEDADAEVLRVLESADLIAEEPPASPKPPPLEEGE